MMLWLRIYQRDNQKPVINHYLTSTNQIFNFIDTILKLVLMVNTMKTIN